MYFFENLFILVQDWDLAASKASPCRDAPVTKCAKCIQDWDMNCDYSWAKYTKCVGDWDIRRAQLHQCWRQKIGCAIAFLSWKCIENVDGKKLLKALLSEISIATPHSDYVFCMLNGKTCKKKRAIFRPVHVVYAEWPVDGPHWARHHQWMKKLHT